MSDLQPNPVGRDGWDGAADVAVADHIEPRPGRRVRAIIGTAVGVLLVGAAVAAVALRRKDLVGAMDALAAAPWWMVAMALGLPLVNWVLVSLALWVITARYGAVRAREMMALVAGAWLLNYLPMRPGMVGRIAYHRAVNGIPIKTSMGLLALSMSLTAASIVVLAGLGVGLRWAQNPTTEAGVIVGSGVLIGAAAMVLRAMGGPWRVATALLLRYLDMLVWVARYWIVFHLVGQRLSFEQACAIAAVSQAATAIPLSGNGLGLREWAVALAAGALPSWFGGGLAADVSGTEAGATMVALAADLVNRGVEIAVALPVGLLGMGFVARRVARHSAGVPESSVAGAEPVGAPEIHAADSAGSR